MQKKPQGFLKGEYGKTPAPVDAALQARVLEGAQPITDRPADHIAPEWEKLAQEVTAQAKEKGITLAENAVDDVLIVALFQQVGWKFLENRHNPAAFEPAPTGKEIAKNSEKPTASHAPQSPAVYTIEVEGKAFVVKVSEGAILRISRQRVRHKRQHNLRQRQVQMLSRLKRQWRELSSKLKWLKDNKLLKAMSC